MQRIEISLRGFLSFHKGIVNAVIHVLGISLAVYGVWTMNWPLIIVAPLIMEAGHAYNHFRKIESYPVRVLPLQLATYITFLVVVYLVRILIAG
ncbi:MAG: hypothetical protein HOO67_03930 [Candidatus Peribacteraceae bacterium]|nr:hypothetical protein [Candidatus Peribacteraceae bacterium]